MNYNTDSQNHRHIHRGDVKWEENSGKQAHTHRQTEIITDIYKQRNWKNKRHLQTDKQTDRHADIQDDMHEVRQTGRQSKGRQVDRNKG